MSTTNTLFLTNFSFTQQQHQSYGFGIYFHQTAKTFCETQLEDIDFNNLEDKVDKLNQLIDVAGLFIKIDKTSTKLKTRAGENDKQDVYLRNERGDEIRIAFWGKNIDLLLPLFEAAEQKTVIIVTALIVKSFNDNIYLQATYGTKIYIDFNIPQATALINSPKKSS
ncbi:hypothetical protein FRX31_031371 [Thalictrum thalictroides]|uniref:Replication protein A OB domain-containing protein n=1 Tax=Thalictrum thalictroides TaxID=46969 RepID=A0A7J6V3M5_THATH|nr:hypothetical protein FRX31_031371 [Thalictrum thalictroides]